MRSLQTQHPQDFGPPAPDTVHTFVMAAGVAQAADYPSTGLARYMAINGTAPGFIHYTSTAVAVPTTSVTSGSSGVELFGTADDFRKIPAGSTGYSVVSPTTGYVSVSFWN